MTPAQESAPDPPGGAAAVTSAAAGRPEARGGHGPPRASDGPSRDRGPRSRRRLGIAAAGIATVLCAMIWLSLALGAQHTDPASVWRMLLAPDPADPAQLPVTLRIPRTIIGIVAGAALGAAGAVMQGLTRNPLADPGLLGVNAAASLAVVLTIAVLGVTDPNALVWAGMAGALAGLGVVLTVSLARQEGAAPATVPVVGMSLTAMCTAGVSIVLLSDRGAFSSFRHWQIGSLAGRGLEALWPALPALALGALLAVLAGPALNLLALGDDLARGLGARLGLARTVCLGAVVLLCGAAVSVVGPIAFLGLVAPQLVRAVTGPEQRLVIAGSALLGPVLLLAADVAGRLLVPPGELAAGLVVSFLGAPVLVLHARRLGAPHRPARSGRGR